MRLFLLIFFLIYGSMHLYAFLRLRAAFNFSGLYSLMTVLIMALMLFAPIIVRFSEKSGFDNFAKIMSYTGYIWLGVLFLFVSTSLIIDIYRLVVYSLSLIIKKDLTFINLSPKTIFILPFTTAIFISIYGYFEALNIVTERIHLESHKISGKIRIVQISDVHLGLIVREKRLKKILEKIKEANPDILVSTGDLVDGQIDNLNGLFKLLREINPPIGKFAVTGNHEYYAGLEQSLKFINDSGFKILRNEISSVNNDILIAGVDDPQIQKAYSLQKYPEEKLLNSDNNGKFVLLLKHRPFVDKDSIGLFDLQLSGHVHKGQIFPFSLLTKFYYPVHAGFKKLSNSSYLYVSRGSGTWGPPIRFLSKPEITIIDIITPGHG